MFEFPDDHTVVKIMKNNKIEANLSLLKKAIKQLGIHR